jgi:hypothetical protein
LCFTVFWRKDKAARLLAGPKSVAFDQLKACMFSVQLETEASQAHFE